jgi:hypothetical protein
MHSITAAIMSVVDQRRSQVRRRFVELIALKEIPVEAHDELSELASVLGLDAENIDGFLETVRQYREAISIDALMRDRQELVAKAGADWRAARVELIRSFTQSLAEMLLKEHRYRALEDKLRQYHDVQGHQARLEQDFPAIVAAIKTEPSAIDPSLAPKWAAEPFTALDEPRAAERAHEKAVRMMREIFSWGELQEAFPPEPRPSAAVTPPAVAVTGDGDAPVIPPADSSAEPKLPAYGDADQEKTATADATKTARPRRNG